MSVVADLLAGAGRKDGFLGKVPVEVAGNAGEVARNEGDVARNEGDLAAKLAEVPTGAAVANVAECTEVGAVPGGEVADAGEIIADV